MDFEIAPKCLRALTAITFPLELLYELAILGQYQLRLIFSQLGVLLNTIAWVLVFGIQRVLTEVQLISINASPGANILGKRKANQR